jgi:hypothetical protein
MAHDAVYRAARLIHSLAPNLEGNHRAKHHAAQTTKNDPLKEEPVP